jgi:hypothetical protein
MWTISFLGQDSIARDAGTVPIDARRRSGSEGGREWAWMAAARVAWRMT